MKKTLKSLLFTALVVVGLSSCNKNYENSNAEASVHLELADMNSSSAKEKEDQQTLERQIIKEGTLRFETPNAAETRKQITSALATYKGYIAQDNAETYGNRSVYTLTLRVPTAYFEKLLQDIGTTATQIDNQEIKALDVTEEFIDVASRIQTKKELENRYKSLLNKANKVEEILLIEKEIEALRSDIESYEGRLNYLKDKVAYSTLTTVFYEKQTATTSFGAEFTTAFSKGWDNLVSFTLGLFYIWPFILLILGVFFFVRRQLKRRKAKNKPQ